MIKYAYNSHTTYRQLLTSLHHVNNKNVSSQFKHNAATNLNLNILQTNYQTISIEGHILPIYQLLSLFQLMAIIH